ncbi:MAG: hypothetical protein HC842_05445 [Cytophagales bacterium]|nr:hypothetical protein [Cytophagales bacterium]
MVFGKKFPFSWKEVIADAKKKDSWIDEIEVLSMVEQFDLKRLDEVRWINQPSLDAAERDRKVIVKNIAEGDKNDLYVVGQKPVHGTFLNSIISQVYSNLPGIRCVFW